MTALENWLAQTEAVEVSRDEDGPYATPSTGVPDFPYRVSVTNGLGGHDAAGTLLARCGTKEDAELVAEALRKHQARLKEEQ